jgi:peptidoglycan/LPS O-acetylase OafA/YrhL
VSNRKQFLALDSLRGISATFVVFYHFEGDALIKELPFIKNAFLFVDFFFVLSGFVIAASYGQKLQSGFPIHRFMFLRLARLYPLHAVVLFAYVTVATAKYFSGSDMSYSPSNFLLSVLLLQVWTPYPSMDSNPWNPPSWSISAEIWMYLLFAILCRLSKERVAAASSVVIVAAIPFLLIGSDRYLDVCFSGIGFARCALGFSFGVLAFTGLERLQFLKSFGATSITLTELGIAGLCLLIVSAAGAGPLSLLCPILFAVSISLFSFELGAISRILLTRPMRFIGLLSYSIYMVHDFLLARFVNLIGVLRRYISLPVSQDPTHPFAIISSSGWSDVAALGIYAIVLAVSYVTFRFVEMPCREWSRKLLATRSAQLSNA